MCPASPCGSPTSASRGGSCTRRPSTACGSGICSWKPAATTGWSQPGTAHRLAAAREGLPRWGSDITSETNPFSAGLGFAVKMTKNGFVGRDALAALAPSGGPDRLACSLDDPGRWPSATSRSSTKGAWSAGCPRRAGLLARALDRLRLATGRARGSRESPQRRSLRRDRRRRSPSGALVRPLRTAAEELTPHLALQPIAVSRSMGRRRPPGPRRSW